MSTHTRRDLDLLERNLLSGKLPRNLSWALTVDLIGQIGEVQPHGNNEFVFTVGTQRAVFKCRNNHELGVEEVARLRKFLRDAIPGPSPVEAAQPGRMVVVIDHHAAHVYRDFNGKVPQAQETVRPYDPFGFHHHLIHRKEAHYEGQRVPEEKSFYEEIVKDLLPANKIVLVGHGTGTSSAVDHLAKYLKEHHDEISQHVIAIETVDLSALTAPEIEAIAKRHMIAVD